MRLKLRDPALTLVIGLALGLPASLAWGAPTAQGADTLLQAARMWDGKQRGDLARQMLEKYLLARPDSAEALLMLGELELRSGQPARAEALLQRLRQHHPQARETRDLALLLRLQTRDGEALAQMRLLARAGQYEAALAELRRLLPDGPPPGDLALEYYRILAQTPKGEAEARQGLEGLRQRYPGDIRYELALTQVMGNTAVDRLRALQTYARLARQGDAPRQQLLDAWRSLLYRLPEDGSAIPHLQAYLAFAPEESAMAGRLRNAQLAHAAHLRQLADPAYQARLRALKELDRDEADLEQAEADLRLALARRPQDPEVLGGLGLVQLRRGQHAAAREWFQKAARQDPESQRWVQLAATARFWGLLRQAEDQLEARQLPAAEASVRAALALDPRNPEARATLAAVQFEAGQTEAAEQGYRQILADHPTQSSAVRGLTRLLVRAHRQPEALALLARQRTLLPAGAQKRYADLEAGLLRDEADAHLAARRPSRALESLEHALLLAPSDPWVRYDLARLYSRLHLPQLGRRLMQAAAEQAPDGLPSTYPLAYAQALYLHGEDDPEAALAALARIPLEARTPAMQDLEQRARLDHYLAQVSRLDARGETGEALRLMQIAERQSWQNPANVHRVAHAWVNLGQTAQAQALMQELLRQQPGNPAHLLDQATILNRCAADTELAALLPRLQERGDWNAAQVERLLDLETDLLARQIDQALQAGRPARAQAHAEAPLTTRGNPLQLQKARARLLLEARDYPAALPLLQALHREFPGDTALGLDLARAQAESGDAPAAHATLETLQSQLGPDSLDLQLALVRQLIRMNRLDEARARCAELRDQHPDHAEVLLASGRVERAARRYEAALAYFQKARQAESNPVSPPSPGPDRLARRTAAGPARATAPAPGLRPEGRARLPYRPCPRAVQSRDHRGKRSSRQRCRRPPRPGTAAPAPGRPRQPAAAAGPAR